MTGEQLGTDELANERAELLPDREVLSVLTDSTALPVPALLGGTETTDTGAAGFASGPAGDATDVSSRHLPEASAGDTYSPTETASAG